MWLYKTLKKFNWIADQSIQSIVLLEATVNLREYNWSKIVQLKITRWRSGVVGGHEESCQS